MGTGCSVGKRVVGKVVQQKEHDLFVQTSCSHGVLGKLLAFSKLWFPCASAPSFQDTCAALCKCPARHPALSWCLAEGIFVITCVNVYEEWGLARRGGMLSVCSPIPVLIKNLLSCSALRCRSLCVCVSGRVSQKSLWGG